MIKSLRVALALIRVPRLFVSLLLFPLLVGIGVAYAQLIATGLYLKLLARGVEDVRLTEVDRGGAIRQVLFPNGFGETQICEWTGAREGGTEHPPSGKCTIQPLDVAVIVPEGRRNEADPYIKLFKGLVPRVHLCTQCVADLTIRITADGPITDVYDVWAIPILNSAATQDLERNARLMELLARTENIQGQLGAIQVHLPGFREPVNGSEVKVTLALVITTASLVVVALWLALKAHRKVLDYFAQNDVLLPLVASCGRGAFYGAIWWITTFRVGAFFLGTVPGVIDVLSEFASDKQLAAFISDDTISFVLWIIGLFSGLTVVTVTASVGELRHREFALTFLYKYIPFVLWCVGSLLWCVTIIFPTHTALVVRNCIAFIPVIGLTPIMLSPIFKPPLNVLVVHALLAVGLVALTLKRNARWFAAHLEEV